MFREKYILDNEMIKPDEQLLASLKIQMKAYAKTHEYLNETMSEEINPRKAPHNLRSLIKYGSFVACFLLLLISITTLGLQQGSSKDTAQIAKEEAVAETTTESSKDMGITEFSGEIAEDSDTATDSTSRKTTVTEDEAKISMELAPSSSFMNGKITITIDTVDTILISNSTNDTSSGQAITDKVIISDLITCLNTLTLTPVTKDPLTDVSQERTITIQYNNGNPEDIIYIYNQFIKYNDSEWYELSKSDSEQLDSIMK